MKEIIQQFLTKAIVREVKNGDTITYFSEDWQELAQIDEMDSEVQSITWFDPKEHAFHTEQQQRAFLERVKLAFGREHLQLEVIEANDDFYVAQLSVMEPTYNILLHSTGMTLTIGFNGTLEDVTFWPDDVEILYPEKMIPPQEAKAILQQTPLMKLMIRPEVGWHYVYGPDFNIGGVETDGKVRYMMNQPEMEGAEFQRLPNVTAATDIVAFLQEGRTIPVEVQRLEDVTVWEMYSEEPETISTEDSFIQACIALKTIVGDEYPHYYLETAPNLYKVLGIDPAEQTMESFRFIYVVDNISLDFHATELIINKETNRIQTIIHPMIPYAQLKELEPPKLTVEDANAIAQKLVDVELHLERQGFDSTTYSFIYSMDYPTSPTKGHIEYIDAWTGEVHFVETGL